MMTQEIERVLAGLAAKFGDRRHHVMKLSLAGEDHGTIRLAGKVLDHAALRAAHEALRGPFPNHQIDDSGVVVLRRDTAAAMHVVATTLTDLHADASFLSEMLTQVMFGQPLEVLEEHEKWAFVRQADGYLGWAYRPYLAERNGMGEPTHLVCEPALEVVSDASDKGPGDTMVSRVLGGTFVRVSEVRGRMARIEHLGGVGLEKGGWVPVGALREVRGLKGEGEARRERVIADARKFIGVYYLWGGNSGFGTDCSGLVQLAYRMSGHTLPRDCDLQFAATRPLDGDAKLADLAFFHSDTNPGKITHVGLSLGGTRVLHSSRARNGVYEDDLTANENLRKTFVGFRRFLD